MSLSDALTKRRSIRFYRQQPVEHEKLNDMLEAARQTSCACNFQRLRFVVITSPELAKQVFAQTAWAGLVQPRRSPVWGINAAQTFIAITAPAPVQPIVQADAGAAIQSMQIAAYENGLGCCWLGAIKRPELHKLLQLDDSVEILYLLAVGYPAEHPVSEDVSAPDKVSYYLDDNDLLHIPKLTKDVLATWK